MRFPEFSDEWENKTLKDILKYEQPAKYIVNDEEYLQSGVPVLTANKSFILGYTKENTNIYKKECFIFDDFTLDMKYVNFPFKVKSSAIKIITANKQNNIYFWYNYLKRMDLVSLSHNRHWISQVSLLQVKVPNIDEQLKIANFLSLIDKRIELQNKIIKNYKLLKKGIQNYFFKNINSDNSYSLSCFLEEYTLKNLKNNLQVVSVGKYGIRQRNEIYSKVLSDDLSKNKVIFQDTLTIGMVTKQIDFGILSKSVEYCVSPAYRTYKIKNINSEYLKYYLEIINNQLSRKYMIISARQGTTIDNKSFLKYQLVVHPILKQNYIVNVINIIQKYLTISDDILETHKDLKKYLLKHIFI